MILDAATPIDGPHGAAGRGFWRTGDFWQDVLANIVAFGIVAIGVLILERGLVGRRIDELH